MWHPSVIRYLEQANYHEVGRIYEEIIENNPNEITNYWYLGLAYLLQGLEEEANLTWLVALNELTTEKEWEERIQDLTEILNQEAQKQQEKQNYHQAWIIRHTLREFKPNHLSNLLSLLSLSIELNIYQIKYLITWEIIELLKKEKSSSVTVDFLVSILSKILTIPNKYHVSLGESALIYTEGNIKILECIKKVADKILLDDLCFEYGIDLLQLCFQFKKDRIFLVNLHSTYRNLGKYSEARTIIDTLMEQDFTTLDKLNTLSLLLNCYLYFGQWDQGKNIESELLKLWNQLLVEKQIPNKKLLLSIYVCLMVFLYLGDNLKTNRYLFNETSALLYQENKPKEVIIYPQTKEIRPLNIGYIGHTFRNHSVGLLSRWLISHHNTELFRIHVYNPYGIASEDFITEKYFKTKVDFFFSGEKDLTKTINQIKDDRIDLLVDVDSITSSITSLIMIEKPAPIQITWLGLDASGLPSIDYYIADPYVIPNGQEKYYREKIWRLPNTYLAIDGFEVGFPTVTRKDLEINDQDLIFLNLQTPSKLNPTILKAQLQIIKALPNAYLCIKIRKNEEILRELVTEVAQSQNISSEKLRFLKFDHNVETHRANLAMADVILDTYPYNGSTTTLEALWLEIPVITRVGEQFAARNSYTYMINAGITEGIAWSDEEYIQWGIKLGTDENLRKEISWKLRQSKKTSPLWNGKQFAREMEKAYQQMWEIYVNS
jgi:predicted O-linked N-acetylglucosamine transferase (SPINDLY family)